jgi:zinc transport system substrate-binding protein
MNMKKKQFLLTAACSVLLAVSPAAAKGVKAQGKDADQSRTVVAVSIVPEKTFAEAVCGDFFDVITMIPPGYDPENYEPTPQELVKFSKAAVFFSIGVPAEESHIIPSVSKKTKIVHLSDEVAEVYPDRKMGDGRDPHIWLSPKRAVVMIQIMEREFSVLDPAHSSIFKKNAEAYTAKINAADKLMRTKLSGVKNRSFIVFHPAFGYFADDFGFTMYALEEEGKEATAGRMMELTDTAKKEHIKAVFYQAEIDSSQAKALAEEIGGKTIQLEPLSADYIANLERMADTIAAAAE